MDYFIGEIRIVAFDTHTFLPYDWAECDGQVLPIAQNQALFALIGKRYGGDGVTTFALPDLRDRAPLDQGQGTGLTAHTAGQSGGHRTVVLQAQQMPSHTHAVNVSSGSGNTANPTGSQWAKAMEGRVGTNLYQPDTVNPSQPVSMNPLALTPVGGGSEHNNMPPYLVLKFLIALQGYFPVRAGEKT